MSPISKRALWLAVPLVAGACGARPRRRRDEHTVDRCRRRCARRVPGRRPPPPTTAAVTTSAAADASPSTASLDDLDDRARCRSPGPTARGRAGDGAVEEAATRPSSLRRRHRPGATCGCRGSGASARRSATARRRTSPPHPICGSSSTATTRPASPSSCCRRRAPRRRPRRLRVRRRCTDGGRRRYESERRRRRVPAVAGLRRHRHRHRHDDRPRSGDETAVLLAQLVDLRRRRRPRRGLPRRCGSDDDAATVSGRFLHTEPVRNLACGP